MDAMARLLSDDGPFARRLPGFHARPQQQAMACAVAEALARRATLVVEAGTGVGKTFAYLAPALAGGGKVLVSTGTRHLQDQLYHKDLPVVREALGWGGRAALLKGRANYLCLHRLEAAGRDEDVNPGLVAALRRWARRTRTGDIAEFDPIPERHPVWPRVTSTPENCLGQACAHFSACWVVRARRAAQEADLVVVNHHLFLADLALREGGFEDFLPSFDAFVLDEAHQLPEIAPAFFGGSLSSRQLQDLVRDVKTEQLQWAPDVPDLRVRADRLKTAVLTLREGLGAAARRGGWNEGPGALPEPLDAVEEALRELEAGLRSQRGRALGLDACAERAAEFRCRLELLRAPQDEAVHWFETAPHGFVLHRTPVEVADPFAGHRARFRAAWVFTSATLSVDGRFDHFATALGLGEARGLQLDSPFDYARNALLYLPTGMPDPNDRRHTDAVVEVALPLIRAWGGRTFLLFTSHRALERAADRLRGYGEMPLLVQGAAPRRELLERFRESSGAVLLGTSSFWEGVDVKGDKLKLVIIDKLPFKSPGDPLYKRRLQRVAEQGGNAFRDVQIPEATIALRQGVGRLIRDITDQGIVMIADNRLITKSYGKDFLNSLPDMQRCSELAQALEFAAKIKC